MDTKAADPPGTGRPKDLGTAFGDFKAGRRQAGKKAGIEFDEDTTAAGGAMATTPPLPMPIA
jgi:hypothetical protein